MTRPSKSVAFLGAVLGLLIAANALAVPARPYPIKLTNDDGTSFMGRMYGDEYLSWIHDLDGYAVAFDRQAGAWFYAELGGDGRLVPGVYRVGAVEPARVGLAPLLTPTPQAIQRALAAKRPGTRPAPKGPEGDIPNLVLLVRFANQTNLHDAAAFEEVFNGAQGSVRHYFQEVSYGKMNLNSTIVDWIDLPNDDEYYAWNEEKEDGAPWEMLTYAISHLGDQGFDFTQFDSDSDGVLDAVCVIHSGGGYENTGNWRHVHSHYDDLTSYDMDFYTHDNIHVVGYHTEPEVRADEVNPTEIGVVAHETGHFFGLPDLYDYGYDSGGVGLWGIMCNGNWGGPDNDGTVPSHMTGWSKLKLGFVDPVRLQANTVGYSLPPLASDPEIVVLDAGMPSGQYFILENRQPIGFDTHLPGSGLLIYHIDDNLEDNDDQEHYMVDLEQADGLRELNLDAENIGDAEDAWPFGSNNSFTPSSTPNSLAYGHSESLISVSNIANVGDDMIFDVDLDGEDEPQPQAQIAHTPANLLFIGRVGKPEATPVSLLITNAGLGSMTWNASCSPSFLNCYPSSGSAPGELTVTVDTASMLEGTYNGTIELTSPEAQNSPQLVQVVLVMESDSSDSGGCGCAETASGGNTVILTLLLMLFAAFRPRSR